MTMRTFVYEPDSGIVKIGQTNAGKRLVDAYAEIGERAIICERPPAAHIHEMFVERRRLRARPALHARINKTAIRADGQDYAVIRGVPKGATVTVTNGTETYEHEQEESCGLAHISTTYHGELSILVAAPPHLEQRFTVRGY